MLHYYQIFIIVFFPTYITIDKEEAEKVYNGYLCPDEEYKSIVSLRKYIGILHEHHKCGGTLLGAKWVLTAAHCWNVTIPIFAAAGTTPDYAQEPTISKVSKAYIHPKYESDWKYHDIALFYLKRPIRETEYISYGKIPTEQEFTSEKCSTVLIKGWGIIHGARQDRPSENKLQCALLPLLNATGCADYMVQVSKFSHILCAYPKDEKISCSGDSGGPVVCQGVQVGIMSWGRSFIPDTCDTASPDVYMRVDAFLGFINDTMKLGSSKLKGNLRLLGIAVLIYCLL